MFNLRHAVVGLIDLVVRGLHQLFVSHNGRVQRRMGARPLTRVEALEIRILPAARVWNNFTVDPAYFVDAESWNQQEPLQANDDLSLIGGGIGFPQEFRMADWDDIAQASTPASAQIQSLTLSGVDSDFSMMGQSLTTSGDLTVTDESSIQFFDNTGVRGSIHPLSLLVDKGSTAQFNDNTALNAGSIRVGETALPGNMAEDAILAISNEWENQVTGTITDDDLTPVASVADTLQKEGSDVVFVVTLSAASGKTITVDWATADGSALAGSDYMAASGTLTFGPGATEQTITVSLLDDLEADPDEGFSVLLSNLVNAEAGDVSASLDDLALALER